jgi:hypothetical protein
VPNFRKFDTLFTRTIANLPLHINANAFCIDTSNLLMCATFPVPAVHAKAVPSMLAANQTPAGDSGPFGSCRWWLKPTVRGFDDSGITSIRTSHHVLLDAD